jgi:hypothetical protein
LPRIDLWAVFPTGRTATTKARTFTQFVQEVMRAPRGAASVADLALPSCNPGLAFHSKFPLPLHRLQDFLLHLSRFFAPFLQALNRHNASFLALASIQDCLQSLRF